MTDTTPVHRACPANGPEPSGVDWYFPDVERDNTHLERWCMVVGQPIVDSVPTAPFGPLSRGEPLAVAVWNTDAGAGDLTAFLRRELGASCAGPASSRVGAAPHFVLLVQEALRRSPALDEIEETWVTPPPVAEDERPGQRIGIVEIARRCGLSVFYAPAARNGHQSRDGRGEDKGNAILSTLPLSDLIVLELPFESARRVVVAATIHDTAGDSLRVMSVHLITTPQAWRVLTTANSSRLRQATAIVGALEHIEHKRGRAAIDATPVSGRPRPISTIVAGDFNTWSNNEAALRHLLRAFPDSPRPLMDRTRGPFPTDHLLFRRRTPTAGDSDTLDAGTYRRIDSRYYSDHHAILAYFGFGGR